MCVRHHKGDFSWVAAVVIITNAARCLLSAMRIHHLFVLLDRKKKTHTHTCAMCLFGCAHAKNLIDFRLQIKFSYMLSIFQMYFICYVCLNFQKCISQECEKRRTLHEINFIYRIMKNMCASCCVCVVCMCTAAALRRTRIKNIFHIICYTQLYAMYVYVHIAHRLCQARIQMYTYSMFIQILFDKFIKMIKLIIF